MPPPFCEATGDVMVAGAYVKSFCLDAYIATYADAKSNCEANGMRLFKPDSADASSAVMNYATSKLAAFKDFSMFLEGQTPAGCATISNADGTFKQGVKDCTAVIQSVCEYIKK